MMLVSILMILLITVAVLLIQEYLMPVTSWARYGLQQYRLSGCNMRHFPLVQLVATQSYLISWETTCQMSDLEFGWTAVPLKQDEDGLGRKVVTMRTGGRREVESNAEHLLGASDMEYIKMGSRQHHYRLKLKNIQAEHLVEYYIKISSKDDAIYGSFPVLPDLTSPIPPPSPPAIHPIEIAIVGDNQNGASSFTKICKRIEKRNPHLLIHVGDMVQRPNRLKDWQTQFFDPLGWNSKLSAKCPVLVAYGNHEAWWNGSEHSKYIDIDRDFNEDKENKILLDAELTYHALSVGPVRFIVLDSNIETDVQASWLERELSKPSTQKSPYKVILCHVPPFIEFWNPKTWAAGESNWSSYVKSRLQPLFEKYRVDLVVSGHQHNFQRGMLKGINYVITGGSGGKLDKERVADHRVFKETRVQHHYLMMSVARNGLSIRVYSVNDRLLDSFYIPRSFARKMKPSEMLPQ